MTTMEAKNITHKKLINSNLITLKCLLFFFFGGMGCIFPFLPLHMLAIGLTIEDARIVSIVSSIVAMIGPMVVGPVADKLAGRQGSNNRASTGRYLRVMIAVSCIFAAMFYSLLIAIPRVERVTIPQEQRPSINFTCNESGAKLFKNRCKVPAACHEWGSETFGTIQLTKCRYNCYPNISEAELAARTSMFISVEDEQIVDNLSVIPLEARPGSEIQQHGPTFSAKGRTMGSDFPHICFKADGNDNCYAWTESSNNLLLTVTLEQAINPTAFSERCIYPISDYFSCRIPKNMEMIMASENKTCSIDCELNEPYAVDGNILHESQCLQVIGNPDYAFWTYLVVRSIADIFPTAAITLLDAAVVIATRETSCGRGDVGRQFAFGSLGFAIFGPLTGYLTSLVESDRASFILPLDIFAALMIISALIALSANGMPLSPPEWWWHTRCGMLALPMSAIKRYGSETAALLFVLVVMGIFWSALNTYLPWHLAALDGDVVLIGVCITVGALPAVIFLWKSEHLIDYCGHSNLLITAITMYIVRFVGLSMVKINPWWSLASEAFELFTLGIMWITTILYLRHLVPRHLTVTGQALPVVAHFCIGRCIGAIIGAYVDVGRTTVESLRYVYKCMAVTAAVTAGIYFLLYHGLLKPKCHPQSTQGPSQPPTIMQAMNGNGNYTPLRVYHNGRGKKGQFRY